MRRLLILWCVAVLATACAQSIELAEPNLNDAARVTTFDARPVAASTPAPTPEPTPTTSPTPPLAVEAIGESDDHGESEAALVVAVGIEPVAPGSAAVIPGVFSLDFSDPDAGDSIDEAPTPGTDAIEAEESASEDLFALEVVPLPVPPKPIEVVSEPEALPPADLLQPSGPGASSTIAIARPNVTFIPVFDGPDGNEIPLKYEFLDGSTTDYPLVSPTFFGGPLTLSVVDRTQEGDWLNVQLPVRPTGSTAWIRSSDVEVSTTDWYVEIDVATNQVRAWKGDDLMLESHAVTGRSSRPTPLASTYIDDKVRGLNSAYGPWMLTLAAFSESLNTFGGGIPKLAIHGTDSPQLMGQYASSGCIRLPNAVIEELAALVPVGTRVDIVSSR